MNEVESGVTMDPVAGDQPENVEELQPHENAEEGLGGESEVQASPRERVPWEELMKDSEYNRAMQDTVQKAVRSRTQKLDAANARIAELERMLGQEPAPAEDGGLRPHWEGLCEQAQKLKENYPDFDLAAELEDPTFLRHTSPEFGIPLETAYYAVHKDELQSRAMALAAKATEQKLANSLQNNRNRPVENGARGQGASLNRFDYSAMSPAEKKKFLEYASAAFQRGEKVYLS